MNILKWTLNFMELSACLAGFLHFKKLNPNYWKAFPFYLALIFIIEMTAKWAQQNPENIIQVFNLYTYFGIPIQFLFFFWLFYQHDKSESNHSWAVYGFFIYIASLIVDELFLMNDLQYGFKSMSYTCGNMILTVLIFRYFYQLIKSDELLNFNEKRMFWVCLGLLIFYLGTMPYFGLFNTLRFNYPALFKVYWYVQMIFNICMYLCFTIGFIWSKSK